MKVCSLFSGIGGIDLGFQQAGFDIVWANEIDKYASDTYEYNFGSESLVRGNIKKIDVSNIPEYDILVAGFPCQAFSTAGKQRGFDDDRGDLFFQVARVVEATTPKVIFLENVKNFASHDGGNTLKVVEATLDELGYDVFYKVLNSVDYGMPQKRERIYIICFRKDLKITNFEFPKPFPLHRHVEDFVEENSLVKPFEETKYKNVFATCVPNKAELLTADTWYMLSTILDTYEKENTNLNLQFKIVEIIK